MEIAPLSECRSMGAGPRRSGTIAFDPATSFTMTAEGPVSTGDGEIRAWFDPGDEALDPAMLLFAADALPPATFSIVMTGWVPTLELTVPAFHRLRFSKSHRKPRY